MTYSALGKGHVFCIFDERKTGLCVIRKTEASFSVCLKTKEALKFWTKVLYNYGDKNAVSCHADNSQNWSRRSKSFYQILK